ncbi:MAG: hypothetical protein K8H86_11140 [Ignavibacteriaceae bacterium]|nr:hypothetical protein [Ignavibacteriaceae bacterium]
MKKYFVAVYVVLTTSIFAQIVPDQHYLGPSLGLSFLGSTFQLGANYEYGMKLSDIGTIGVGGIFRYWSYKETYFTGHWNYVDVMIGAQGNYYFKIDNEKIEPWAGLVLAINNSSVDWQGTNANYAAPSAGGFWLGFQGGARYWLNPKTALSARVSFGTISYGGLEVGVDFRL